MRKTRVLAALLCIMMVATVIPVMQVSATATATTYTLAQALEGAEQVYKTNFVNSEITKIDSNQSPYYDNAKKYVTDRDDATKSNIRQSDGGRLAKLCDLEGGFVIPSGAVKLQANTTNIHPDVHCQPETVQEDGSLYIYQGSGEKMLVADVLEDGLALRAGNDFATGNPGKLKSPDSGEPSWSWDDTNANTNYHFLDGKLNVNTGYAGAMLFKLKLTTAGSVAEVNLTDGANGQQSVGFKVSNDGIQMINASNFAYGDSGVTTAYNANGTASDAKFPLTTGTWYEILLKNNYNRYTIYAREVGGETPANFTKVVTGTPAGDASANAAVKKLTLKALYNATGVKPTKLVTIGGTTKEYLASYVTAQGWVAGQGDVTAITDGVGSRTLSEVIFESITTYEDSTNTGLSLQDALGANAYAVTKMDFNKATTKEVVANMGSNSLSLYGAAFKAGNEGDVTQNGIVLDSGDWLNIPSLTTNKLDENTAFEFSYKLAPYAGSSNRISFQGRVADSAQKRIFMNIGSQNNGYIELQGANAGMILYNSKDLTAERTFMVTLEDGYLKYYMKNPVSGKYLFLFKDAPQSGNSENSEFRLKNAETNATKADHTITGFAIYKKTGMGNAELLPGDTSGMLQYVNEDFTAIDEANYAPYTGESGGANVTLTADGSLKIERPDYVNGNKVTYFDLNNASIPKGGYANIRFRPATRGFRIFSDDGDTRYLLTIHYNSFEIGVTPDALYDLRISRSAEGNYSAYLKRAEESGWIQIADNVAPTANATGKNRLRLGGADFAIKSGETVLYSSSKTNDSDYIDSVVIYGPVGQPLTILDGNANTQVTRAAMLDSKLTYGAKAIVAPGAERTLIFAGYAGDKLVEAIPVTVEENALATEVDCPLTDASTETIRVFLWDNFETMASQAPAVSFTAPD